MTLFYQQVYSIVKEIPAGRVVGYKQLAALAGFPQHARLAGRAMHDAPLALGLPCHRVVSSDGRLVPGWHQQKQLLEAEGVAFKRNGCVDMKQCVWKDAII